MKPGTVITRMKEVFGRSYAESVARSREDIASAAQKILLDLGSNGDLIGRNLASTGRVHLSTDVQYLLVEFNPDDNRNRLDDRLWVIGQSGKSVSEVGADEDGKGQMIDLSQGSELETLASLACLQDALYGAYPAAQEW